MKPFIYNAVVKRVVDGDTVDVDIDLGFYTWLHNRRIRLRGVDTPEKRTRDPIEKQFGILATSVVEGFCPVGAKVLIETDLSDKEKFGRILGDIYVTDPNVVDPAADNTMNLNQYLIDNHYAVPYFGLSKEKIILEHLANYKWLEENGKIILE